MTGVRKDVCWRWLLLVLLMGLPGWGAAQTTSPPVLDGLWKGPLKLPGGQIEVLFRFMRLTSGDYFATLDVPQQKVHNLTVTVTMRADTVILVSAEANSHYIGRIEPASNQIKGEWQQPGLRVPMLLTRAEATKPAKVRLTPPYREESVSFTNTKANLKLSGELTVPAGQGPFPAVVLLSDAGPQDRNGTVGDFAPLGMLGDYLTRRGIAVLRFDDRGVGQSTGAAQATTSELVSDAQAALNYLRTRPEIDFSRLGLVGHGEGGNVALLAATQPVPPAFVVGLAPYGLTGANIALQQQETTLKALQMPDAQVTATIKRMQSIFEVIRHTPVNAQAQPIIANMLRQNNAALDEATAQANATEMLSGYYRYYLAFDPIDGLAGVACPVLLLYGTADPILNPDSNSAALLKGMKSNSAVAVRKLLGVNHLFQPDASQWPLLDGQPHANFSPVAEDAIRAWIMELTPKK